MEFDFLWQIYGTMTILGKGGLIVTGGANLHFTPVYRVEIPHAFISPLTLYGHASP